MITPTNTNTKTITDLREDTINLLKIVGQKRKPVFLFKDSRPANVVMVPQDEYLNTLEMLEDYSDELEAIEFEKEPKTEGVPLADILKEFNLKPKK